jgi:hypothetical protein
MADEKNANQDKSFGAAAGAQAEGTGPQEDVKAKRGGVQSDQITGQTQEGAHNQETENRNPQGNKPDQNQSAGQQGDKF